MVLCLSKNTQCLYALTEIKQLVSVIDTQCTFHQVETRFSKYCLDLTVRLKTVSGPDPKFNLTSLTATYVTLAQDSTLTLSNKRTLYKLVIRSILTYAASVWSNTSSHNYRRLQISQSKCLRVIGNYPRRTAIPYLHAVLNIVPIRDLIYRLTATFFGSCPAHPNPLISSKGNYTLADLRRQYTKYIHKRPKHILL
jgi:hypothetical protein